MPELLLYALDESTLDPAPSPAQLAQRRKPYDAVVWQPDGRAWGEQELTDPKFRIVSWVGASEDACAVLLSPELPVYDESGTHETTYLQPCSHYMNLLDPRVSSALPDAVSWWQDATRAKPIYVVPADLPFTMFDITLARAPVQVV